MSEPPARVGIVFANLKGNLGDIAILNAMMSDIQSRYDRVIIDVFDHPIHAMNKEVITSNFGTEAGFFIQARLPSPSISIMELLAWRIDKFGIVARRLVKKYKALVLPLFTKFEPYDELTFAGGDQWCGRHLSVAMFGTLLAASASAKKITIYPFSLKKSITSHHALRDIRFYFALATGPIKSRDSGTKDILATIGTSSIQTRDAVFSLFSMNSIRKTISFNPKLILIAVKGSSEKIASLVSRLKGGGFNVGLISTCAPEDFEGYQGVTRECDIKAVFPPTWIDTIKYMSGADLVISNRLHGLIFSTFAGVPVLPILDRAKSRTFANDVGLDVFSSTIDQLSINHVKRALDEKDKILSCLVKYATSQREGI